MHILVIVFVIVIVALQITAFIFNFLKMRLFRNIFRYNYSWRLFTNDDEIVAGINGDGNKIFQSIIASINKYLSKNAGGVIDFALLKDSVDRHCDSTEEEISILLPIPLYLGLCGTMIGVIFGLWDLDLKTIQQFFSSEQNIAVQVAISNLLHGIAWAMVASLFGIALTTFNSLIFKSFKKREERDKNDFFAWMQSELLPALPDSAAESLNMLSRTLNKFNDSFAQNCENLNATLTKISDVCGNISDIYNYLRQTDMVAAAQANSQLLETLTSGVNTLDRSTVKIERFNDYLHAVDGYLNHIQNFEQLFERQENRLQVLEKLSSTFDNYKNVLTSDIGSADEAMREACKTLAENTKQNVRSLAESVNRQNEAYNEIIEAQKQANNQMITTTESQYGEMFKEIREEFRKQISTLPDLVQQIENIPAQCNELAQSICKSNEDLTKSMAQSIRDSNAELIREMKNLSKQIEGNKNDVTPPDNHPKKTWWWKKFKN